MKNYKRDITVKLMISYKKIDENVKKSLNKGKDIEKEKRKIEFQLFNV